MSKAYNTYLLNHKEAVYVAYNLLKKTYSKQNQSKFSSVLSSEEILMHDNSKYSLNEYHGYDCHFYPEDHQKEYKNEYSRKFSRCYYPQDEEGKKYLYDKAWLHHIHNNPHHWQYWVSINDNGSLEAIEIPKKYVIELLCDWLSFDIICVDCSYPGDVTDFNKYYVMVDSKNLKNFYDNHKNKMIMHPKSKRYLETLIDRIRNAYPLRKELIAMDTNELMEVDMFIKRMHSYYYLNSKDFANIKYGTTARDALLDTIRNEQSKDE